MTTRSVSLSGPSANRRTTQANHSFATRRPPDRVPTVGSGPGRRSPPSSETAGACRSASRPAGNGCTAWASRSRCRAVPPQGGHRGRATGLERGHGSVDRRLRREHHDKEVEFWAEDEARLGLKPIARRVWAVRGRRPISSGRTKYQWLYVYGFVHPSSGRNLELLLPSANADWMGRCWSEFARWADPGGRKLLVVLVDNAAGRVIVCSFEPAPGMSAAGECLPPSRPHAQPAEYVMTAGGDCSEGQPCGHATNRHSGIHHPGALQRSGPALSLGPRTFSSSWVPPSAPRGSGGRPAPRPRRRRRSSRPAGRNGAPGRPGPRCWPGGPGRPTGGRPSRRR